MNQSIFHPINQKSENDILKFQVFIFLLCLHLVVSILSFTVLNDSFSLLYYMKYISIFFATIFFIFTINSSETMFLVRYLLFFMIISIVMLLNTFNIYNFNLFDTVFYTVVAMFLVLNIVYVFKVLDYNTFKQVIFSIFWTLFVFMLLPNIYLLVIGEGFYTIGDRVRFTGNFYNPNELARFSSIGFILSLKFLFENERRKFFIIYLVSSIGFIQIVFATDSRAALFLCLLGGGGLVYSHFANKLNGAWKNVIKIIFLGQIIYVVYKIFEIVDISQIFNYEYIDYISSGRLSIWMSILFDEKNISQYLFGNGVEREGLANDLVTTNGYIEVFNVFGLVGLLAWGIIITIFLLKKISIYKNISGAKKKQVMNSIIIVLSMLVYYVFESGIVSLGNIVSLYFWIELTQRYDK